MKYDLEEQQQDINQADSEEELQEEPQFTIDYEQLKQNISFYVLILIQVLFVFISKWIINDKLFGNSNSSNINKSSTIVQKTSNSNEENESNQQVVIWSTLNILIMLITVVILIFSIAIYRKQRKQYYYKLHRYLNYFVIAFYSGYIFSKPSPSQNIFFMVQKMPIEKVYDGVKDNEQTEMYDLYFLLMLNNKIYNHSTLSISISSKIILHIIILILSLNKTSVYGYIALGFCALQFIMDDIIQAFFVRKQQKNQILYCSCSSLKGFESQENTQNQFFFGNNKLNTSGVNQFCNSHPFCIDTNFNDQSGIKQLHHSNNHSFSINTLNNISRNGLIGKKGLKLHKLDQRNCQTNIKHDNQKKPKKLNISSINNFWNVNKKDQLKLSGEINYQADEKWQYYLNQIPSGIILVKKNLKQIKFANEFIRQFFLRNFRKFNEDEILDMILREIEFKILSHIVNHTSNEKKRITRFSSSAKKQIRESISNAEKKSAKRSSNNTNPNNIPNQQINVQDSKNSIGNFSLFHVSIKNNNIDDQISQKSPLTQPVPMTQTYSNLTSFNQNQTKQTESEKTTLESILINFDQNHTSLRDIENSTLEIYAKVFNIENKESISIKGKVLYRSEGDEFLIILEDNTKYENVTNLADRDDYKNRLISSFSHELRTPLNSSMGFVQSALLDDLISQDSKDMYLVPAYQALKLQYYFINDILDFSQILAKKDLQLNFVKFNIAKLVYDIKDLYENSFVSKGIELIFQLDSKVQSWEICTDYDRLMQVLVNLINNSLRFTLKGGVTIKVNPTISNNICIHVIDTGEGMNMQQFEQIKQKLNSFGNTGIHISETQHTGFGLTISQIIVSILATESNQDLEIKKTQGGGCTFSFCIENILNLQTSYSFTSHNNSRLDVLKSGTKFTSRKDLKKQTYAHKSLEKQTFAKNLQFSSHNLYTRQNKELQRGNSVSISKIDDSKTPKANTFKTQASAFKKSVQPLQDEDNQQTKADSKQQQQQKDSNDLKTQIKKKVDQSDGVNKNKSFSKNSLNNLQMILSQNESFKLQNEGEIEMSGQQNKTLPQFQVGSTPNNVEEGMQISTFNFHNQQNSSYSLQKRFFVTQSQAILSSYNNIHIQKEKSIKTYDNDFEDIEKSLIQNDSSILPNEFYVNKFKQYNFNSLIHKNEEVFHQSVRKFTNLNIFDSVIEHNEIENIVKSSIRNNERNLEIESIQEAEQVQQKAVDNDSTSAQIPFQEESLLECIEVQTPPYNNFTTKTDVDLASGTHLNGGATKFNFKFNTNQSNPPSSNSNKQEAKKQSILQNKSNAIYPSSNKIIPNFQNNVKFFIQNDSKTTSIHDESNESQKSPRPPQSVQKNCSKKGSSNLIASAFEGTFGIKRVSVLQHDTFNQDIFNKTLRNIISFDPQQQKHKDNMNPTILNQNSPISPIDEQNINNDYSQSNIPNTNFQIKTIENMNNVFQNQMQLSEQFSEISWQIPQNFQNNIHYNQNIHSTVIKKSQLSPVTTSQQMNQTIYQNVSRMKQELENPNHYLSIQQDCQINQNSNFNTETAYFIVQKEGSSQNNGNKLMKGSSWLRKGSLQLIDKEDKSNIYDVEGLTRPHQMSEIIERPITANQQIFMKCQCKRILCVDDEIFNLQVLMFLFKKLDYQIEKTFNGKDAINTFISFLNSKTKYQCESPNCTIFKAIILDCNMPVMNGWDCAKQLRNLMNQKKLPSIPIIALTAYVAQQAYNQCIESGMDDVLNKPINIDLLRFTVEKYIHLYETDQKNIQWV